MRKLKLLRLEGTLISNAGLAHLSGMSQMELLALRNAAITNLDAIGTMARLKALDLDGSSIGDAALETVANFRDLEAVWLGNTMITDVGLAHICALPKVQFLDLRHTHVHDDSVPRLCGLPLIANLDLSDTDITDCGLDELADGLRLTPCRILVVGGRAMTPGGIRTLRLKLPAVTILVPEPRVHPECQH